MTLMEVYPDELYPYYTVSKGFMESGRLNKDYTVDVPDEVIERYTAMDAERQRLWVVLHALYRQTPEGKREASE